MQSDIKFPTPSVIAQSGGHALTYDAGEPSRPFSVWNVYRGVARNRVGQYEKRDAAFLFFLKLTIGAELSRSPELCKNLHRWLQGPAQVVDAVTLDLSEIRDFCDDDELDAVIIYEAAEATDFCPEVENALTAIASTVTAMQEAEANPVTE